MVTYNGRERNIKSEKPRIIIEEMLDRDERNDLPDYKFFCFGGRVFCLYCMIDYADNHSNGKCGFFDRKFKLLPYYRTDFKRITEQIPKPKNFEKMVEIAEALSKGFPHGKILFGEMTFCTHSGFLKFEPDEFNFILGEKFVL